MGWKYRWDDQWIKDHYDPKIGWRTLLSQYNNAFGIDIKYPTFVSHMNRELKLEQDYCLPYTSEQDQWLIDNFPHLGRIKTTELFNEKFHENKKPKAIAQRCKNLGLHVTKERKAKCCVENHKRSVPIGHISYALRKGVPAIKVSNDLGRNNWIRLDEMAIGKKRGMVILHLDGNPANCNPDNLVHITRKVLGQMAGEGFFSNDKDLTKAGVLWCELYNVLGERKENLSYGYTEG